MERGLSRRVSEQMMRKLLGKGLPRRLRRVCGRAYGAAAYRVTHLLSAPLWHRHSRFTINGTIASAIAVETQRLMKEAMTIPDPPVVEVADGQV